MQLTKTTEYVTRFKKEEYNLFTDINLVVNYTNDKIVGQSIPCSFKNSTHFTYTNNKKKFLELFQTKYFHYIDDIPEEYVVKDYKTYFENNEFKKENLFNVCWYDHTLRDYRNQPIPILRNCGYIGGFQESSSECECYHNWKWNRLGEFLLNHKKVFNLKEITIPYYNQDFGGQRAFEFDVIYKDSLGIDAVRKMIKFLGIDVKELCY